VQRIRFLHWLRGLLRQRPPGRFKLRWRPRFRRLSGLRRWRRFRSRGPALAPEKPPSGKRLRIRRWVGFPNHCELRFCEGVALERIAEGFVHCANGHRTHRSPDPTDPGLLPLSGCGAFFTDACAPLEAGLFLRAGKATLGVRAQGRHWQHAPFLPLVAHNAKPLYLALERSMLLLPSDGGGRDSNWARYPTLSSPPHGTARRQEGNDVLRCDSVPPTSKPPAALVANSRGPIVEHVVTVLREVDRPPVVAWQLRKTICLQPRRVGGNRLKEHPGGLGAQHRLRRLRRRRRCRHRPGASSR